MSVRQHALSTICWLSFPKTYAESQESARITEKLHRELQRMEAQASDAAALRLGELLREFAGILGGQ